MKFISITFAAALVGIVSARLSEEVCNARAEAGTACATEEEECCGSVGSSMFLSCEPSPGESVKRFRLLACVSGPECSENDEEGTIECI